MESTLKALKESKAILVCSHVGPDGDAMASMLAMGWGMEQLRKQVFYYNHDGVPEGLKFLPGSEKVISEFTPDMTFDVAISMDCGSFGRLGEKFAKFKGYKQLINIDHHASNDRYGHINYVLPEAASTGEVVWKVLKALNCRLTPEIATNIYCTLVTDTGSFRYSNTSAHTLRLAAEMVDAGAIPDFVSQNLFECKPVQMFPLLGRMLERLTISHNGRYSWAVIFLKDLQETKTTYDLTEEFIDFPRAVKGVEVALLFKELENKRFKISLRAKSARVDVSKICQWFGGGGHKRAAACIIPGSLDVVQKEIFSKLEIAFS